MAWDVYEREVVGGSEWVGEYREGEGVLQWLVAQSKEDLERKIKAREDYREANSG